MACNNITYHHLDSANQPGNSIGKELLLPTDLYLFIFK